ncbi:GntR family transcriptional regulator [Amycolatopsis sp. PS_44_ISF1]|uniref:GntR family transcriptional regulator n=1 Tax=Amycolatopsis sp. PS_44_ISF1 TaxID=2974917 RepID=UPI0028DDDFB5|nr:GntR family transcriptional regulator [Amycolatopsis sp. PS_44_ISF1]MDT8912832.1 GntR family transcriptional regulator [Amycolatopsis sp. PS_44_ISF1]
MATTAPVPVKGDGPARDRVYAWLRDGIISGALEGGRFLDELWVSGVVGVSRTPVREAFHRLEAERFISLLPRKGAQVRTVTARELEEVYQSRRLIEGHALGEVCAARAGAPEELAGLIEEMDRAGRERDWFAVSGLDRRFHRAIVDAAGNSVLTELYDTLRSRQQRVAVRALEARPERLPIIAAEHRRLVDAIAAHEGESALRLLDQHLRPVPEVVSALGRG